MNKYADAYDTYIDAVNEFAWTCINLCNATNKTEDMREEQHQARVYLHKLYNEVLTQVQYNEYEKDVLSGLRPLRGKKLAAICSTIAQCFSKGLSVQDCKRYVRCTEEYNPRLAEDIALKRMRDIMAPYNFNKATTQTSS
jgi:hypothetical protein